MDKNKLVNHDDILRSLRVEVSVTHVMFPVGDCHINGSVAFVAFHSVTCLKNKYLSSITRFKVSELEAKRRIVSKMGVCAFGLGSVGGV